MILKTAEEISRYRTVATTSSSLALEEFFPAHFLRVSFCHITNSIVQSFIDANFCSIFSLSILIFQVIFLTLGETLNTVHAFHEFLCCYYVRLTLI